MTQTVKATVEIDFEFKVRGPVQSPEELEQNIEFWGDVIAKRITPGVHHGQMFYAVKGHRARISE
jgi:hypothetical protein